MFIQNCLCECDALPGQVKFVGSQNDFLLFSTEKVYCSTAICQGLLNAIHPDLQARLGKLPPKAKSIIGSVSAWTATLLFMWSGVAQWVSIMAKYDA